MTITSTSISTNRFLEVLNGFSDRKTQKRSRAEAVDHFVQTASTVLYTSSTPAPSLSLGKRAKVATTAPNSTIIDKKETTTIGKKDTTNREVSASVDHDDLEKADTSMQHYQNCLDKQNQELNQIDETRNEVLQEIVDVWGVYKYGLLRIGALADLSEAPDAIMPGNF